MQVLHITNNYPTVKYPIFGIFIKEQIESLNDIGIENSIYLINGRENGKYEYIKQIFKIKKYLKRNSFDIIHCHHALSAITLFLSGCKKNNVIISFQNDPANELGETAYKWLQKKSNKQIFKNNSQYRNNDTGFYVPNGVNIKLFYPIAKEVACKELCLDWHKNYILFVSSNFIRKQKCYDRYKKTLSILRDRGIKVEELILTNTKRELIPYYFNAADIHLITSDFEGSPNSVKEAMACNTPVISTPVGNVHDLLNNVKGSFVSKSSNEEELADLVIKAMNSNEHNGRKLINDMKLDIHSVAKKLKQIYLRILLHK